MKTELWNYYPSDWEALQLLQAIIEKGLRIGHNSLISHHAKLDLTGVADNADAKPDIPGLGYPEHLF
jgi:hypothetical protein